MLKTSLSDSFTYPREEIKEKEIASNFERQLFHGHHYVKVLFGHNLYVLFGPDVSGWKCVLLLGFLRAS